MTKKMKWTVFVVVGLVIILFIILIRPWYVFLTGSLKISPVKTLFSLSSIKKIDDQINIVILGIAGGNHDGPNLSDSIIVANYNFRTNFLSLINLPRDIWSSSLREKINAAYAFGEARNPGGGMKLAEVEIGTVVGLPIQNTVIIDFSEFSRLIDDLGGIDVNIENSFTDNQFPITGRENDSCSGDPNFGCRYESVTFRQGQTHMNGETALKFVRSRHALGNEGSDFARGKRQLIVIEAVKIKVSGILKTFNIDKVSRLYSSVNNLIKRDISNQDLAIVGKNILLGKNFQQKSFYLTEDLFETPDYSLYDGQWVLIPKNNDRQKLYKIIACFLKNHDEKTCLQTTL